MRFAICNLRFAIALVIAGACALAAAVAAADEPDGFRDVKFGDPPAALGIFQLELVAEVADESAVHRFYLRDGEDLTFGGAEIDRVVWVFADDRLYHILIVVEDADQWPAFRDAVIEWLGPDHYASERMEAWAWRHRETGWDVLASLVWSDSGAGHLMLRSTSLWGPVRHDAAARAMRREMFKPWGEEER